MTEISDKTFSMRLAPRTVAVCGSIGVGKTTLVPLLAAALPGGHHSLEDVGENPYLADFYSNMMAWSFHSRIAFLAMKARIYKIGKGYAWLVVDRPINELIVFARFHRDVGLLSSRDFQVFESLYTTLTELLPVPDFIVYLRCSPEESLRRIRARGREFEQAIDLHYLARIGQYYDGWLRGIEASRVIEVDTEDLSGMPGTAVAIARRILA